MSIKGASSTEETRERPPRENLVRAASRGPELRESGDGGMPTLVMRFSPFNEWTEINSSFEGRFMERFAPSAFDKTIEENRASIRVLFQHGRDPQVGDKPLGVIQTLEARADGAYAEVDLLDAPYVRDLLPALEANLLGSSHRFKVIREDYNRRAVPSDYNPEGLPERTVTEAKLMDFGPVTFGAYAGATAGIRSATDEWMLQRLFDDPDKLAELLARLTGQSVAPSTETPAEATSPPERRARIYPNNTREDFLKWLNSQSSML